MSKQPTRSHPDSRDVERRSFTEVKRALSDSCKNGKFYKAPLPGAKVDVGRPVQVSWEPSCLNPAPSTATITLFAQKFRPGNPKLHTYNIMDYSQGTVNVTIDPSWFNKTSTVELNFLLETGTDPTTPNFLTFDQVEPGPMFTGTYDPSTAINITDSNGSSGMVTTINNLPHPKGMKSGQIAAAVLMPILVVAGCIAGYIFWSRRKEAIKRKEYREKLDQRMSIAPGSSWAPISAAGASAAIRQSMAMSNLDRNTRASSFFASSYYDTGEEMPTRKGVHSTYESDGQPRSSRVISFAEANGPTRPLNLNRPAVPPLPAAYRKSTYEGNETISPDQTNMSPTQKEGAFVLDDDSIRDRLSGASGGNGRASVMDLGADSLPALAMMRTNDQSPQNEGAFVADNSVAPTLPPLVLTREETAGDYKTYSIGAYTGNTDSYIEPNTTQESYFSHQSNDPDEALRIYAARNPQTPAAVTASPFSGFASGPGLAAAAGFDMSSPDAIFRAYAATRPAVPPTVATVSSPGPMRTLYNPTMTQGLGMRERAGTVSTTGDGNLYRDSLAPSSYSDDVGKAH